MIKKLLLLGILFLLGCQPEWNNPLDTDSELKQPPVIKEITLTEENNILIKLGRAYSDSARFVVERNEEGIYVPITIVCVNEYSFMDSSFDKETQHDFMYRYRIKKGEYLSEYCQSRTFHYSGEFLYAPDNFRQQTIELKGIRFYWRDRSHTEDGYVVEKDQGEGYRVVTFLPANSETFLDTMSGVFNPPLYLRYRIYAKRENVKSPAVEYETEYSGLGSPTNLRITDSLSWRFTIEWQDNSHIEDGYLIEREKDGNGYELIKNLPANTTKYTTSINEVGTYSYRVRAYKDSYYSEYSNDVNINISTLSADITLFSYINSYKGHTYWLSKESKPFHEAEQICESQNGHLITISNADENEIAKQCALGVSMCYIGFTDENSEGNWIWVTGEPVTYTNWNSGEPNNLSNEDYAVIYGTGNNIGRWNDVRLSESHRFILEIE